MPKVNQEHLDARRCQIMDAAMECFAERGIHKTTMRDIIKQSGLSMGAIYQYFKSKDEIIAASAAERHEKERSLIASAATSEAGVQSLRKLATDFLYLLRDEDERQRRRVGIQLWAEALHDPGILTLVRAGLDEPMSRLVPLIEEARRRGQLPPALAPDAFARVMIALFQGFILQQAWNSQADSEVDVESYVGTLMMILDGLVVLAKGKE